MLGVAISITSVCQDLLPKNSADIRLDSKSMSNFVSWALKYDIYFLQRNSSILIHHLN